MPRTTTFGQYRHHRPFWLLVALAVMLLVTVSTTARAGPVRPAAAGAGVAELLGGIERDLAALRIQLELIGAGDGDLGGDALLFEPVALNPGLGDGGRVFRVRSLETMARSLERRIDRLIEAQHRAGNGRGLDIARLMSLDARSVQWGIEELRFAREPHLVRAARERIGHTLGKIARGAAAVSTVQTEAALGVRPEAG